MSRDPVTIAVLGAGALLGQGIIKSLRQSTLPHRLVALDAFPYAVGLYWADATYVLPDVLLPEISEETYLEQLIEFLRQERADLVFVATDFDVPAFAMWIMRRSPLASR